MSEFTEYIAEKNGYESRHQSRPYFLFDVIPVHPMSLEDFTLIYQCVSETIFDEPFVDGVHHRAAVEYSDVHGMHITGETSRDGYDHILDSLEINEVLGDVRIRYLPPGKFHWQWRPGTKMDEEVIGGISRRHM